ncbi:tetraacyldisaccharide 4'-kinase [Methylobacterium persicinum]|uniref:Tetraacyldisaccharide 4'-kinase n=1 Tax=Methylobacterium persicinum TaxID=374426 RepID=A0ABU0HQ43_9HYPH|nr:tetraacyldisaccharide 4'-kinase [Methylobacterium persicinum]MDQ0444443.1 tetraacyldisaccharide 4'-kinase [Methylobacterium persicinum]GJE39525.1 Tetraacyldisaccharide 4'-kinase [Methylobacterium persicinum]
MRPPGFWQGAPDHWTARLLSPLAALYGSAGAKRMDRPGQRASCPVLCLGNFTLGGAGKTPAALALAAMLRDGGRTPVFLTRGYGGRLAGPVRVELGVHGAADVGDEPLLLARDAPTVVARRRPAGASLCTDLGASVIVMDDGLQNPSLAKDLALAVVDGGAGVGNGRVFPAGPLRVPLARQWPHVGGVILVGEGNAGDAVAEEAERRGLPVHQARLVPDGNGVSGRPWFAFAGIGRPEKFFATLRDAGADLRGARSFPDHHPYRPSELIRLAAEAQRLGAGLVTTEKDAVRLPPDFTGQVEVLKIKLRFMDPPALLKQISSALTWHQKD